MIKEIVDLLRPYRELATIAIGIFAAFFFVRDYFATKEEVEILQCQMGNGIALVESRINAESLGKQILNIKTQMEEAKSKLKAAKADAVETSVTLNPLNLEVDRLTRDFENEEKKRLHAADQLKPGVCEAKVREN